MNWSPDARQQFKAWQVDFDRTCVSIDRPEGDPVRRVLLAAFVQRSEATLQDIETTLHPADLAELHLTIAAAEVDLSKQQQGAERAERLASATSHCSAGTRVILSSGFTAEAAEDLPWALMLLGLAAPLAAPPELGAINAMSASLSTELGNVLTKLDQQQYDCAQRLLTGQLLYGEALDAHDANVRSQMLSGALEAVIDARNLAAVSANTSVRRQAEAMRVQINAAIAAAPVPSREPPKEPPPRPSQDAATVVINRARLMCPTCSSPRGEGRFCTNCGTPYAD